jgi:carbon storage regulator
MLVLTRREGQSIRIGPDVEVRVLRIDGDRVVLGFDAPREVMIARSERVTEVSDEVRLASAERTMVGLVLKGRPGA